MSIVQNLLEFLRTLLNWWFIVEPWEQAVRVRLGKHVRLFKAGVHFRIPFFDVLYIQNTRRRVSTIPLQTLTTKCGAVLTIQGSIGYRIVDTLKLHLTLHEAEASVKQEVLGLVTRYIVERPVASCDPDSIVKAVSAAAAARLERYGLGEVDFFLTSSVAQIPTFRLIQDGMGGYMDSGYLSTANGIRGAVPASR